MKNIFSHAAFLASLALLSVSSLHAQTYYFDPQMTGTGSSDPNGSPTTSGTTISYFSTWSASPTLTDWYDGSGDVAWPNSTSDVAVFGSSSSPNSVTIGATTYTSVIDYVRTVGPLNAAGITLNNYSITVSGGVTTDTTLGNYLVGPASGTTTINGPTGSVFTIANAGAFFNNEKLTNIAFAGAGSYQFTGTTNTALYNNGTGESIIGTTTFDQNVTIGTGSDYGQIGFDLNNVTTGANTVTVNKGWGLYFGNNPQLTTQTFVLNGLGTRQNGTTFFSSNGEYAGAATLNTDASILADRGNSNGTANAALTAYLVASPTANATYTLPGTSTKISVPVGGISGAHNLYLGYGNVGTYNATTGASTQNYVIAGTNNTYTGATIILNSTHGDNIVADGGVGAEAVQMGNNNALPTGTTLILGEFAGAYNTAGTTLSDGTVITAPNNAVNEANAPGGTVTVAWSNSDGAFDLHGYNQTVAGLLTGPGLTTVSSNLIFNNGGAGTASTLTVNGSTSLSSGFGGTLVDDYTPTGTGNAANTGGTLALAVTGGSLTLTGTLSTYTGGTTATGGVLTVNNQSGSATGAGPVTISGVSSAVHGTLAGGTPGSAKNKNGSATSFVYASGGTNYNGGADSSGYIAGTGVNGVTINANGHLAPGVAGVGTITVGDLTLNSGAVVDYESDGSANDFTAVNGAFTLAGPTTFNFFMAGTSTGVTATGVYDLFSYGTDTGLWARTFTLGNGQSGLAYTFVDDMADKLIQLDITTASTPEPSTWAMLLGGVALLGFVLRRRSFNS